MLLLFFFIFNFFLVFLIIVFFRFVDFMFGWAKRLSEIDLRSFNSYFVAYSVLIILLIIFLLYHNHYLLILIDFSDSLQNAF